LITTAQTHELRISGSNLSLTPPKENAREYWINHFHQTLGIICDLPLLRANKFENFTAKGDAVRRNSANPLRNADAVVAAGGQ